MSLIKASNIMFKMRFDDISALMYRKHCPHYRIALLRTKGSKIDTYFKQTWY